MTTPRHRIPRRFAVVAAVLALLAAAAPIAAGGKPGYPDRVSWSGLTWQVKSSRAAVGPGPCVFATAGVSVDTGGALHLRIQKSGATWTCAEVIAPTSYGCGTYTFQLTSPLNGLDPNVVLGLFTWSDKAPYAHREIDIEFARWGSSSDPTNAQYVVQPYDVVGHLRRFTQPADATSTQRFTWRAGRIDWESRDANGALIASYTYAGSDVPIPGDERVHLNLWLFGGAAPTNGLGAEVVVRSFAFVK